MSAEVLQVLRQLVREELLALRTAELAIVQDQHPADPDNYACTVRLRDSDIVLAKVPVATSRLGTVAIPPVGALVLVQFLGGDVNAPIVVGNLYNDADRPPVSADGELVWNLPHDASSDDAVTVSIKTVNDKLARLAIGSTVSVQLQQSDPVLQIDVGGKASIRIASDGQIDVETTGTLNLKANELNLTADANLSLKAGGTLDLQGSVVNLN